MQGVEEAQMDEAVFAEEGVVVAEMEGDLKLMIQLAWKDISSAYTIAESKRLSLAQGLLTPYKVQSSDRKDVHKPEKARYRQASTRGDLIFRSMPEDPQVRLKPLQT